ncbi:MAG: molybdate ABC transporter substrate-binding protein [Thermodesulfobacteriota bacterium]
MAGGQEVMAARYLGLVLALALFVPPPLAAGEKLRVATAANFIRPMTEIVQAYQRQEKGGEIQVSYGSSGKLYGQLYHGAPFDLFLSADRRRPQLLHEQGVCAEPFAYTAGSLVLWSGERQLGAASWRQALALGKGRVAMASPEAAPYGDMARQALRAAGLAAEVEPRLVYGQSVAQAFLFARSGGARFAFIALSQALSAPGQAGRYWPVDQAPLVEQWGCVVASSSNRQGARQFQAFLSGEVARRIMAENGYN